jgi:hypothetical protein
VNTHKISLSARKTLTASCLALMILGGCVAPTHIYDSYALLNSRKIAVLPGVGAPGPDGQHAGAMQAGTMITELANLQQYDVIGGGRMRKELTAQKDIWDPNASTAIARKLGIDLIVLPEVTDYSFTKTSKGNWFLIGSNSWTLSKYWVTVRTTIVKPDGAMVYSGVGSAKSDMGYGPAVLLATSQCVKELRLFLDKNRRK